MKTAKPETIINDWKRIITTSRDLELALDSFTSQVTEIINENKENQLDQLSETNIDDYQKTFMSAYKKNHCELVFQINEDKNSDVKMISYSMKYYKPANLLKTVYLCYQIEYMIYDEVELVERELSFNTTFYQENDPGELILLTEEIPSIEDFSIDIDKKTLNTYQKRYINSKKPFNKKLDPSYEYIEKKVITMLNELCIEDIIDTEVKPKYPNYLIRS